MFSSSSCLGNASAGQGGPLAPGTLIVFLGTLLSSGCHLRGVAVAGREELSSDTLPLRSRCSSHSRRLWPGQPGLQCVIHRVRAALPVSDGRFPPFTMPEVFPQPWRWALTEGWGPWAPFSSHSSWPGSSVATGVCPTHPVLWVTREQTSVWLAWGWENFTNVRT